ncbi:MAG: beta-N-acetylhexosaminidase [Prevotella sp.]|nr:beta-N-acetylhexosaminidase [Prevotella sp.]
MKKGLLCFVLGSFLVVELPAQTADYNVAPLPKTITAVEKSDYLLTANTRIVCSQPDDNLMRDAMFLQEYIQEMTGLRPAIITGDKKDAKGNIWLTIDPKTVKAEEGYRISVTDKGVVLSGRTAAGIFYGIQTLRKSLPIVEKKDDKAVVILPGATIDDEPRFGYRGMHLDCCRHFFSVDFVKQYLDMMALHGMNRFHWHLTEDQGWRMAIDKYPLLTSVGSWRDQTVIGRNSGIYDGQRYGGFYTKKEMKDIVKYAADRYITVIPEVDMPGHMLAALAAYPELGCTGGPYKVLQTWGVYADILCAGNEKVFRFVEDVLDEVIEVFPSEYIHIGGDEAPRDRWKVCPKCQQRIKDEGITAGNGQSAEARLQGYFTKRIQKYLTSKGKKIIGWDELLECDVDTTATIMSWRGAKPGAEAAKLNHDVIMAPNDYCYFDYYHLEQDRNAMTLIGGFVPIEKVYSLEPVADDVPEALQRHIIGVQANLWTEYIGAEELVEYQVLPRMAALAEVQWMEKGQRDFEAFQPRLKRITDIYRMYGWKSCR